MVKNIDVKKRSRKKLKKVKNVGKIKKPLKR